MKPMLFSTDMVRAILEDRKTVTRRVVKPQPLGTPYVTKGAKLPYRPGTILYVRETWNIDPFCCDRFIFRADGCYGPGKPWRPSIHEIRTRPLWLGSQSVGLGHLVRAGRQRGGHAMNPVMPLSNRKKKPVPYRCDTCGDRECRRKRRSLCWTKCVYWRPELLPADAFLKRPDCEKESESTYEREA